MTRHEYEQYFTSIATGEIKTPPYDDFLYFDYTKLNASRYQRWIKKGRLDNTLIEVVKQTTFIHWTVITEPWCGDAAHSVPFIALLAQVNPAINLNIELRDSAPFTIDRYLTNGTKSIPVFIFSDGVTEKIWGPRPQELADIFKSLENKDLSFDEKKLELQKWYNKDEGKSLQKEILEILSL